MTRLFGYGLCALLSNGAFLVAAGYLTHLGWNLA